MQLNPEHNKKGHAKNSSKSTEFAANPGRRELIKQGHVIHIPSAT